MTEPIVLDVNPDDRASVMEQRFLVDQDVATLVCPGPLRPGGCPILRKEACPIADAADGVLFHLNLDHPDHRRILAAYIRKYGDDSPIRVVVNPEQKKRWHKLLSLVEVFTEPVGSVYLDGFAAEIVHGWGKGES